jgi:arabinan endo-1,5-alpha-L-arabinosidase
MKQFKLLQLFFLLIIFFCPIPLAAQNADNPGDFTGPGYFDTYHEVWNQPSKWGIYNVHDPSVYKSGDWFYMYSTDVSMGGGTPSGGHKRRSQNLIDWEFLGTAFNGVPQSAKDFFLIHNPNYTDAGIWAPYLMKAGDEYRLYYSAPGSITNQNLGFIGYATSNSAEGPWEDKGRVASSIPGDTINAIDPSVVIDEQTGQHWMAYGSYQMGMYMVELDPQTGGLLDPNDRGHLIARRAGSRHASIEGPEVIYRNGWYYLFVSYDWLEDFYNVRVGRSRTPAGPYLDFNGINMAINSDNVPMIIFPYRFNHHVGWQGTGHNSVFRDGDDYYIAHQARPSSSKFNMVLHIRKMFWINDWPVVSPQRYSDMPQTEITNEMVTGQWEHIPMAYNRAIPNLLPSIITLTATGTINNNTANTWTLLKDTLLMSWNNGQFVDRLIVSQEWDWENRVPTIVYTGMNQGGLNIWGKKVNQEVIQANTVPVHGSAYVIRNHHSNMVLDASGNQQGSNVRQWADTGGENQEWVLIDTGDGYFMISPLNTNRLVLEVQNASSSNGANIQLGEIRFTDNQKWKLQYLNNGYFAIRSKISSEVRALDVNGFSIVSGGNIIQWEYLAGINQFWRLERTQTDIDTGFGVGVNNQNNRQTVSIFPNPVSSDNKNFSISTKGFNTDQSIEVSLHNAAGHRLFMKEYAQSPVIVIDQNLSPGIYLVRVKQGQVMVNHKLVVL